MEGTVESKLIKRENNNGNMNLKIQNEKKICMLRKAMIVMFLALLFICFFNVDVKAGTVLDAKSQHTMGSEYRYSVRAVLHLDNKEIESVYDSEKIQTMQFILKNVTNGTQDTFPVGSHGEYAFDIPIYASMYDEENLVNNCTVVQYEISVTDNEDFECAYATKYLTFYLEKDDRGNILCCEENEITNETFDYRNYAVFDIEYRNQPYASLAIGCYVRLVDLKGNHYIKNVEDTFEVELLDSTGDVIDTKNAIQNSSFSFRSIRYYISDVGKTFTYIVRQVDGTIPGVEYDRNEYSIKVSVSRDDEGNVTLSTEVNDVEVDYCGIDINNRYIPSPVMAVIKGKFSVDHTICLERYVFEAQLEPKGSAPLPFGDETVVTNDENGDFEFPEIVFSEAGKYYYTITQTKPTPPRKNYILYVDPARYDICIEVIDNGQGELVASGYTSDYVFRNIFEDTISVYAEGRVNGIGRARDTALELDEHQTGIKRNITCNKGYFSLTSYFDYNFDDVGKTYDYSVKQIIPASAVSKELDGKIYMVKDGVMYDTTVYTFSVTITANDDYTLSSTVKDPKGNIISNLGSYLDFTNIYEPSPIRASIGGTVMLTGREIKSTDEFIFSIDSYDEDGLLHTLGTTYAGTNGMFMFEGIEFTEVGTYDYRIYQRKGSVAGVLYDASIHNLVITVEDNNGELQIRNYKLDGVQYTTGSLTNAVMFANTYEASGQISLYGEVIYEGRDIETSESIRFRLTPVTAGDENRSATAYATKMSARRATFVFEDLEYSTTGVFCYEISQISGNDTAMIYDSHKYSVINTVTDNGDGTLKIVSDLATPESPLRFVNEKSKVGSIALNGLVSCTGKTLSASEFSFALTEEDRTLSIGRNDASGRVSFARLNYTSADIGTHIYTVVQRKGIDSHMTYDSTSYSITVVVSDNGGEELDATVTRINGVAPSAPILSSGNYFTFTNVYADYDEISGKGTYTFIRNRMYKTNIAFKIDDDGCSYASGAVFYTPTGGTYTLK